MSVERGQGRHWDSTGKPEHYMTKQAQENTGVDNPLNGY